MAACLLCLGGIAADDLRHSGKEKVLTSALQRNEDKLWGVVDLHSVTRRPEGLLQPTLIVPHLWKATLAQLSISG